MKPLTNNTTSLQAKYYSISCLCFFFELLYDYKSIIIDRPENV